MGRCIVRTDHPGRLGHHFSLLVNEELHALMLIQHDGRCLLNGCEATSALLS